MKCVAVNSCCREKFEPLKEKITCAIAVFAHNQNPIINHATLKEAEAISAEECNFYSDCFR